MTHPYAKLPEKSFWNSAVSDLHWYDVKGWHEPKFVIDGLKIATAGSCFAQHIGKSLKKCGLTLLDVEPAPACQPESLLKAYGYGVFSARYGNIYTIRFLLQLLQRALGQFEPTDRWWKKGTGWVDPFRPTIEPSPFVSREEVEIHQRAHLKAVKELFTNCELFIFTMGLTEAWMNTEDGAIYPVVPGTKSAGGEFDPEKYVFVNFTYPEILTDLKEFYKQLVRINPLCKILLTVSPVPLVATATGDHVIRASSYSKSVLRAVAGDMASQFPNIDYFPSFEIISSHVMGNLMFYNDKRRVSEFGVDTVMKIFKNCYGIGDTQSPKNDHVENLICDEEILEAFNLLRNQS